MGIAPPAAASNKSILKALSGALLCGIAFAVVVGVLFAVTKTLGLGVWSWAVYRGIVFGVYAAWLTRVVAQAAINTTLHAEPTTNAASSAT